MLQENRPYSTPTDPGAFKTILIQLGQSEDNSPIVSFANLGIKQPQVRCLVDPQGVLEELAVALLNLGQEQLRPPVQMNGVDVVDDMNLDQWKKYRADLESLKRKKEQDLVSRAGGEHECEADSNRNEAEESKPAPLVAPIQTSDERGGKRKRKKNSPEKSAAAASPPSAVAGIASMVETLVTRNERNDKQLAAARLFVNPQSWMREDDFRDTLDNYGVAGQPAETVVYVLASLPSEAIHELSGYLKVGAATFLMSAFRK